jgi:hypothetical protein
METYHWILETSTTSRYELGEDRNDKLYCIEPYDIVSE